MRIFALVLAVIMTLGCMTAFADDLKEFDATLTDTADVTVEEWCASGQLRALFSTLILVDYMFDIDDTVSPDFDKKWYVAEKDNMLMNTIIPLENGGYLDLYYAPGTYANYTVGTYYTESLADVYSDNGWDYYVNSSEDITTALESLNEIFSDDN